MDVTEVMAKKCWTCSAIESEGARLKGCALCKERGLVPAIYCSSECQRSDWKLHKVRHKQQQKKADSNVIHADADAEELTSQRMLKEAKEIMECSDDKYDVLLAKNVELIVETSFSKKERKLRKAISIEPNKPKDISILPIAWTIQTTMFLRQSSISMLQRFEPRFLKTKTNWALAIAKCFASVTKLLNPRHPEFPLVQIDFQGPPWWNDADLKSLSARVLAIMPTNENAMYMRGHVLAGSYGVRGWQARSPQELREAAECLRRYGACGSPTTVAPHGDQRAAVPASGPARRDGNSATRLEGYTPQPDPAPCAHHNEWCMGVRRRPVRLPLPGQAHPSTLMCVRSATREKNTQKSKTSV